jgi:hypothetical protein
MPSYTSTYGIMTMGLLNRLSNIVKCMCYMGLGSNGYFVTGAALMDSHYRTNIIRGVGHLRSNSIVSLVLCIVAYNIWGTCVVLEIPLDSTEKG